MAERRSFREVVLGITPEVKRTTGFNFFRQGVSQRNTNFIQGYQSNAGQFDVGGLGNGASNSAVVSCLQVLGTAFGEAELKVYQINEAGELDVLPNHQLTMLFKRPNPYMSGDVLQNYLVQSMHISGDAYLLKQKNEAGQLVALYPLMPENVTVKGNDETLISHYEYQVKNEKVMLDRDMIAHFRLGLDPENHRQGFSPVKTLLREIYGDESAGQMATSILANMGVPSFMITPKDEYGLTEEEGEAISKAFQRKTGGQNKGKPLVLSGGVNVEKLAFSPKDLEIGDLRESFESRVSSVLGVPSIIAGLEVGLKYATYSNAKTLREFFTEQKLIPLWDMVSQEITHQILKIDYPNSSNLEARYDYTDVRALQTDTNEIYERMNLAVTGGWVTVAEARQSIGLPTTPEQDVYLLPEGKVTVPANMVTEYQPSTTEQEEQSDEVPEAISLASMQSAELKVVQEIDGEFCVITEETGRNMGCYPTKELAEIRLRQIERFKGSDKGVVATDQYTTEEEAQARAKELGCEGTHSMDDNGNTIYMPCATHEVYEGLVDNNEAYDPEG
jgi:HK97 family phage portal protein